MKNQKVLLPVIAAILVFFLGCSPEAPRLSDTPVTLVESPIVYTPFESLPEEVAVEFVRACSAADSKTAFGLLSKDMKSWLRTTRQLKKYWDFLLIDPSSTLADPGIFYGEEKTGEGSEDLYCFPMSTMEGRQLIVVEVMDGQVSSLWVSLDIQAAEELFSDYIEASLLSAEERALRGGVSEEWEAYLVETGEYISSLPPSTRSSFDAQSIFFSALFANGEFQVRVTTGHRDGYAVSTLTVEPKLCPDGGK